MPDNACPPPELIRAFAVGRLGGSEWAAIAAHVDACAECQQQLDADDETADGLLTRLRLLPVGPSDDAPGDSRLSAAVLARTRSDDSGASIVSLDAGRELARRMAMGPVRLGRFDLRSELGGGSFGYVFRAWDPLLKREVALKVQRAGSLAAGEEADRFQREARSAARLKHPSIVGLHEIGQTDDGVWYLVYELIDGVTLEERMKQRALTAEEATGIAAALAGALQFAHEHGVVHRDVKPSNVILDAQGHPHLMDFGLAKSEHADSTMTSDGRAMGTPAYMSPEQASGASHGVDARSDVYSLGVVLYEMLTGERPFHGNRRLLLLQVLEDDPRPPCQLNPQVPRDLEVICLRAMSKSPARRYATARLLEDDLRRFQRGQPILARPVGSIERCARWCRRNPLAVSLLAAVVVSAGAGLWYLSSLSEYFVRETALESARQQTTMLDESWRFYSQELEDLNPQVTNVVITEDYKSIHPSLPLPATFAIDLARRISDRSPGMEVRVYSRYPWPGRAGGGPQGAVDEDALQWLEGHAHPQDQPPAEYSRFITDDGRRKLLYYTARHMDQSCIGCHNHKDGKSPKKDWAVGDVVGVLKIVRPLDREIESTQAGLRGAFTLMLTIAGALLAVFATVSVVAERRRRGDAQ